MPPLPWWAGWTAPAGFAVLAFVVALAALTLALAVPLGSRRGWTARHWTERARRAYCARLTLVMGGAALIPSFVAASEWHSGPLSVGGTRGGMLLAGAATLPAIFVAHVRLERAVRARPVTVRGRLRGLGILAIVMFPHWLVGITAGIIAPPRLDARFAITAVVAAALIAAVAFDLNVGLVRLLGWARPAGPRAAAALAAAAARLGAPPPRLYELRWDLWSAMALTERRAVMVSDTALAILDDAELEATFAHEVAHLAEPAAARRRRHVGTAAPLLLLALPPLGAFEGWAPLAVFALMLGLAAWNARWIREQEVRADAAAGASEAVPGALARGLAKGYEMNLVPAILRKKTLTHPELYDRMVAAGVAPDFARPAPPPRWRVAVGLVAGAVAVWVALYLVETGVAAAGAELPDGRQYVWTAAAYGGSSEQLLALAQRRLGARDPGGALALALMVPADDSQAPEATALVAAAVARSGECAGAEAWLDRARAQHHAAGRDPNQCEWISRASAEARICRRGPRWQAEGLLPGPSSRPADPEADPGTD